MVESLRQIVAKFTSVPELHQDLMQECLLHLWKLEENKPGHTRSWYLQGCRFHLQHLVVSGRSLDSLKRNRLNNRISIHDDEEHSALSDYHTNGEVFESVCFADVISALKREIKPRERQVLGGLADGMTPQEIASKFGISYPTVIKYRRELAKLTVRLGVSTASARSKENGCARERHSTTNGHE